MMTPEQIRLVELVTGWPGEGGVQRPVMEQEAFLRAFPSKDGRDVALLVATEAVGRKDGRLLELAILLCNKFGSGVEVASALREALIADWNRVPHFVAGLLGQIRDERSVDLLFQGVGLDLPGMGGYRDMAKYSIKALIDIGTPRARVMLEKLALSEDQSVMRALTDFQIGYRWVRASYDDQCVTLYTAISAESTIDEVQESGRAGFGTWFTPSFTRLMAETAWGEIEGRERAIAIRVPREVFESSLLHPVASRYWPIDNIDYTTWKSDLSTRPVRFDWSSDLDERGVPLPYRCLTLSLVQGAHAWFWDRVHEAEDLMAFSIQVRKGQAAIPSVRRYELPERLVRGIRGSSAQPYSDA